MHVYCSDWSSESELGRVITNNGRVMASAADIEFVDSRVTFRIARVCYWPNNPEIIIQNAVSPKPKRRAQSKKKAIGAW